MFHTFFLSTQHAHALELLKDQLVEGAKALDVGSGSGYLTACFARMVSSQDSVSSSQGASGWVACHSWHVLFVGRGGGGGGRKG